MREEQRKRSAEAESRGRVWVCILPVAPSSLCIEYASSMALCASSAASWAMLSHASAESTVP